MCTNSFYVAMYIVSSCLCSQLMSELIFPSVRVAFDGSFEGTEKQSYFFTVYCRLLLIWHVAGLFIITEQFQNIIGFV